MKHRLKIVGWVLLMVIGMVLTMMLGILLAPIWALIWLICGWWFPSAAVSWMQDNFPEEITS